MGHLASDGRSVGLVDSQAARADNPTEPLEPRAKQAVGRPGSEKCVRDPADLGSQESTRGRTQPRLGELTLGSARYWLFPLATRGRTA